MAIITIGGNVGAGKTTLAAKLAKALDYNELYMGGLFREIAAERGMSIETFYAELKNDPVLERSVDERQKKLMREKNDMVIQGRMAWYFAKESPFTIFNIFLGVSPDVGAKRSAQKPEYQGISLGDVANVNTLREKTERERYHALYGITNFLDHGHYDFVLDTSALTENEVVEKIIGKIKMSIEGDF